MSGEGLSVSFRRTSMTQMSNKELLREFQKIVYASKVTTHMKWYGETHSVQLIEHGDEELQKWQQRDVAIKDTFQFYISVYDSWGEDSDLYESHKRDDSFVSLAKDFAMDNWLLYFPYGFPAEWIVLTGRNAWLRIEGYSLMISNHDDRISVALFHLGKEAEDELERFDYFK